MLQKAQKKITKNRKQNCKKEYPKYLQHSARNTLILKYHAQLVDLFLIDNAQHNSTLMEKVTNCNTSIIISSQEKFR
jgi:hypothetical protein